LLDEKEAKTQGFLFYLVCKKFHFLPSFLCLPKETKQRKCTTNANLRFVFTQAHAYIADKT